MLVVVMHNNREYLESLDSLAKKEGIKNSAIVDQKNVGSQLIGGMANVTITRGKRMDAYDKAFLAMIEGDQKTQSFLEAIDNNEDLNILNLQDRGFICTVPFRQVTEFTAQKLNLAKEEKNTMKIIDFLSLDRIALDLKAKDKVAAINELAVLMQDKKEVKNVDLFIKDVFERESLNSTGIGKSIAIPHARTDEITDFVIAFGRSTQGIEFASVDDKKVKLIFLMGTPREKGVNNYLKILAKLTRLLNKEELRDLLYVAKTPEDVIAAFKEFEEINN